MRKSWKQDAEGVKNDILTVAMKEFAESGLAGARIDEIADKTRTSKRMIYYYFGDKDGLYLAALEAAYARVEEREAQLNLEGLAPEETLAELVGFIFDHHRTNPELIRMIMGENMNHAKFIESSEFIRDLNLGFHARFAKVLEEGQEAGIFRKDVTSMFLHWQVQAQAFYNISNAESFSVKFGADLFTPEGQEKLRADLIASVLRSLRP